MFAPINQMEEIIGCFQNKETNKLFEYKKDMSDFSHWKELEATHTIFVCDGVRAARIFKTIAYIAIDENADGSPVWEKWNIKKSSELQQGGDMIPMKLIYKEAHGAAWTGLPWDERLGMASLAAVEAANTHDPEKGRYSTIATTFIRNKFRSEVSRQKVRMRYDGVQVSILTEDQIPAAKLPDTERTAIFKDMLEKLSDDGKELADHALHPSRGVVAAGVTLKSLREHLKWGMVRFNTAVAEIRSILN